MRVTMLKSKIHHATVTDADLKYEGSVSIDPQLCDAAKLYKHEKVDILNCNNGARLSTYVIYGKPGEICLNGAAARHVQKGDKVLIVSYADLDESEATGTTNGFNVQSFNLKQIYWQQFLLKNTFTYRIGKLDQSNVFNLNRLQSDNFFFLNTAFSDNPTMAYPDNGFGFDLTWKPDSLVYLSYGASNTDPGSVDSSSDKFLLNTSWFTVAEVGLTPWIDGLGAGHYRFTGWFTDADSSATASDGAGFAISCDQDFGPKWIGFLRYGLGNAELTTTRQIVSGGFGIKRPIGENDDFAGIGLSWAQPRNSTLRDEMVAEGFYRLQWSSAVQVTADAQLIVHPSRAPDQDVIAVFGVRLRITF